MPSAGSSSSSHSFEIGSFSSRCRRIKATRRVVLALLHHVFAPLSLRKDTSSISS
jgi:hypothetical protein